MNKRYYEAPQSEELVMDALASFMETSPGNGGLEDYSDKDWDWNV